LLRLQSSQVHGVSRPGLTGYAELKLARVAAITPRVLSMTRP
jgi:hypothetical protein